MVRDKNLDLLLLQPYQIGELFLPNRVVMAPLTRKRAGEDGVPNDIMATYYTQRATAGLIIAEATNISPQAKGYPFTPGIFNDQQVDGWKNVTKQVHEKGGRIFLQLWHVGRYSHPDIQPNNELPVAPSPIRAEGMITTPSGKKKTVVPRALKTEEIPDIVDQYKKAAENALRAGFDGVEIHAANGYLLDQFIQDSTNKRTDRYGGSLENRARIVFEVIEAILKVWDSDRVGVRLSPSGIKLDMFDSDPVKTFSYVIESLNRYDLAYLHLIEPVMAPLGDDKKYDKYLKEVTPYFRKVYNGTIITNGEFDLKKSEEYLKNDQADLIAFGKLYISNPDLVERFAKGAPLNDWNKETFYSGGERGYIDYPTLI